MSTTRVLSTSGAAGLLALLAATGVVWSFRLAAALLVGVVIAAGMRWRLPVATGAGLFGLVLVVGAGPASTAPPWGLLAWVVPTWVVVVAAAGGPGAPAPTPRDMRTRLRLGAGELAAVLAAIPLLVLVGGAGAPAVWGAAGGVAVVMLLVAAGAHGSRATGDAPAGRGPSGQR